MYTADTLTTKETLALIKARALWQSDSPIARYFRKTNLATANLYLPQAAKSGNTALISIYPDAEHLLREKRVAMKIGKALKKMGFDATPALIDEVRACLNPPELQFTQCPDEAERIYNDDTHVKSCMTGTDSIRAYFMRPDTPLQLAYIENADGEVLARAIVDIYQRVYIRVYGDSLLSVLLEEQGYTLGCYASDTKIWTESDGGRCRTPYVDGVGYATYGSDGHGEYLLLDGTGDVDCQVTGGWADAEAECCYACEDRMNADDARYVYAHGYARLYCYDCCMHSSVVQLESAVCIRTEDGCMVEVQFADLGATDDVYPIYDSNEYAVDGHADGYVLSGDACCFIPLDEAVFVEADDDYYHESDVVYIEYADIQVHESDATGIGYEWFLDADLIKQKDGYALNPYSYYAREAAEYAEDNGIEFAPFDPFVDIAAANRRIVVVRNTHYYEVEFMTLGGSTIARYTCYTAGEVREMLNRYAESESTEMGIASRVALAYLAN